MKRRISGLSLLLAVTWAFAVYHRAVAPPPAGLTPGAASAHSGRWVPRSELGINQLILWGTPLERGLASGALTRHLLLEQERSLSAGFERAIPSRLARAGFVLLAMRWFWGIDRHIEPGMLEEMYGVSRSAPVELDYLADGYTRQIAYHGLHEVGQMFVDHRGHDRGCTVFLVRGPQGKWMVGRNLDFEGGRIFDDEKILKWVFPPLRSTLRLGHLGRHGGSRNRRECARRVRVAQRGWKRRLSPVRYAHHVGGLEGARDRQDRRRGRIHH